MDLDPSFQLMCTTAHASGWLKQTPLMMLRDRVNFALPFTYITCGSGVCMCVNVWRVRRHTMAAT